MRSLARLLPTAVFGGFDGMTAVLGVIIIALTQASTAVFILAVGLALSEGLSMAAGEWLADNDSSWRVAGVMGIATVLGILAPALPFTVMSGASALVLMAVIVAVVGFGIAMARTKQRPLKLGVSLLQTYGLLAIVTLACGALAVGVRS